MKPRHITYTFVLTLMLLLIAIATAPLVGVQLLSITETQEFNGFSLMLLATAGFLLYFMIKTEQLHDQNWELEQQVGLQTRLTNAAQRSERFYRVRLEELQEHADHFPEPFQTYIYNVIANGSLVPNGEPRDNRKKPYPTATLYREDYNDYQWYRLLLELGAIDDYDVERRHSDKIESILDGHDLQMFKIPDIEVLFVR